MSFHGYFIRDMSDNIMVVLPFVSPSLEGPVSAAGNEKPLGQPHHEPLEPFQSLLFSCHLHSGLVLTGSPDAVHEMWRHSTQTATKHHNNTNRRQPAAQQANGI